MRAYLLSLGLILFAITVAESQVVSAADIAADWIVVRGVASAPLSEKAALEQMAQRDAIQKTIGSSITFSDHAKEFSNQYTNYSQFMEVRSELLDGVWRGYKSEPTFYNKVETIERDRGRRKDEVEMFYCEVEGYASRIRTIPVAFEYRVIDQSGLVVAEHPLKTESSKIAYQQNDEMVVEFRSSQGGHLTIYLDDGNSAFRLLPYSHYTSHSDMTIEAQKLYRLFDRKAAEYGLRDYVDEIVMATDQTLDVFRLYFIFSQTPMSRDFFLASRDKATLVDGVESLMSIESREFARWLQQSRMTKDDLQVAIVDIVVENKKNE